MSQKEMRLLKSYPPYKTDYIVLAGGLDLVTPPLQIPNGRCRLAQNMESDLDGGYISGMGYERLDGRARPSNGNYAVMSATITGAPVVGNTLTGVTSGATGVIIALPGGSFVLTKLTGSFQSAENLQVAAVTVAVSTSAAITDGASSLLLAAQYKNLAADSYRADIAAIPGSGIVRGIVLLNDIWYGFRDNAGGTAGAIYKSAAGGWTLVPLLNEVRFSAGGTATPADGAVLTQGAVTATVRRVVLRSGAWTGTAAGNFVIEAPSGGNFGAGAATLTGGATVTLTAIQTAITILPGGRYELVVDNFTGLATTKRVYGCDRVNRGFEFDGTYYVPITTGMAADTPTHVHVHKLHLFFGFASSAQHSGPGFPFQWSPVVGAGELGMGYTVTGFKTQPGSEAAGAMAICTAGKVSVLYGNSILDWKLTPYKVDLGARAHTIQDISQTIFLDDVGITTLQATQAFGNFAAAAISNQIRPQINTKKLLAISSCLSKDKNQYRIFYSDGTAHYVTFGKSSAPGPGGSTTEIVGIMPMLFPDVVRCVWSGRMNDGSEAICFGSANGFVYQMERGTSYDGADIEAYMDLAFNFSKSPRTLKSYFSAAIDVSGTAYGAYLFSFTLGYGSTDIGSSAAQTETLNLSSGAWDLGFWNTGSWDASGLTPSTVEMDGDAENVSLKIYMKSDYYAALKFNSVAMNYIPRQPIR